MQAATHTPASRTRGGDWTTFLVAPFLILWRHRRLLQMTARNDVRARYAASVFGTSWLFLYPLLFLGAYSLIYIYVFHVRFAMLSSTQYVALIFCGLIPFLGFTEGLSAGVGSVTSSANLLKNTLFPIELIPVKAVLVSQCTQVVGTGLLLIAVASLGKLTWWALLLPLIWAGQIAFSIGLMWILSSLNVFFRDLQNMISVAISLLMMASPIAYSPDMVPSGLRPIVQLNPLYYLIVCYQDCLMAGRFPRDGVLGIWLGLSLAMFCGGCWFFCRLKAVFVDNV
jgi:lipopolysaccharide transport system permease protein